MAVSQISKQIAKGALWSLSGSMALKLISFFYLVILARMASQSDIGLFYLALSIFGIIALFTDLGLRGALMRYIPFFLAKGENAKIIMLLKFTYAVTSILSIAITAIVFFFSDFLASQFNNPGLSDILRLFSPFLLLNMLFLLNTSFLNGLKKIREQSSLLVFQNAGKLIISTALFFFIGANLFSITAGFLLSLFVALIASFFYIRKPISKIVASVKKSSDRYSDLLRDVIPFGITISIITSFWLIINHIDRIMIGYFLVEEQVAVYTIATSLAMLIMIFPSAIGSIFFPVISELFGKNKKEEMVAIAGTSLRWMLFIIMPLAIVMIAFPDNILNMFYGPVYGVGGVVLAIFTFGLLIRSLSIIQGFILAGMRLVRIELKVAAAAAIANVILNLLFIPVYGIEGAAISSAIAFLIATLLFIYYSRKIIGFKFPLESLKAVFAGLLALGLIFLLKPYLTDIMSILPELGEADISAIVSKILRLAVFGSLFLIAGAVYLSTLFLLKTFTSEDVELLAAALRKAKIPQYWIDMLSKLLMLGVRHKPV
jgi:O-antigen/teichoic acid export membrane protein